MADLINSGINAGNMPHVLRIGIFLLFVALAAMALGVPQNEGIALFAEIQPDWSVNHNWMISYAYALFNTGYIPGFIGNTNSSINFNFGRQCSHYVQFMKDRAPGRTAYWATEPKEGGDPKVWTPYCPSKLTPEQMDLWRKGKVIPYGDMKIDKNYARDESVLQLMW